MERKKKVTNAQLQRRIEHAVIHIDRTKETKEVYFSDRGLRLIVTEDTAIVETGFHRHVFNYFTSSGISRPYLYVKRFVEMALENDCVADGGYSYSKLIETLNTKEDKGDYNIAVYIGWWFCVIFDGLYSIGESEAEQFLVYFRYLNYIAMQSVFLDEKVDDVTNKQFADMSIAKVKEFIDNMNEYVIFPKKTDEEVMKENIEAIQEQETNDMMEAQTDGSKD